MFWRQLQSPLFAIYCELLVAARTDDELRQTLAPAQKAFERAWQSRSQTIFPDLALSKQFWIATAATRYMLEGIAINTQSRGRSPDSASTQEMLSWLKETVSGLLSDVSRIDRNTCLLYTSPSPRDS